MNVKLTKNELVYKGRNDNGETVGLDNYLLVPLNFWPIETSLPRPRPLERLAVPWPLI